MPRLREFLLLVPLAAIYAYVGWNNPELAPQIPLFLAFFAAFVAVPALGLGGLLVRLPLSFTERLALGAPAALAMLFGLTWAAAALRQPLLVWGQPVLGLLSCLLAAWAARRWTSRQPDGPEPTACPALACGDLLLLLAVLAAGLALCLPKLGAVSLPEPGIALEYYTDDTNLAAHTFAVLRVLEHGLPVVQPWVAGMPFSYHLLYHYCQAASAWATGLHPLDLLILYWPPALWLLLAGAVVAGCRRLAGFSLLETAVAALLLLFSAGHGFYSAHGVQLFGNHHSYFAGLPAVILLACALYGHLSGRTGRLFALHAGLLFLVASGTKAMLMVLLPLGLLPVFLLRALRRQTRLAELGLAGLTIAAVAALRLTMFMDTDRVALRLPSLGKLFMGFLGNLGEMAVAMGLYVVLALLAAEANPVLHEKLRRDRQYHLFCLAYVLVSALLLKMFNFQGGDFYFYWHGRVLVLLAFVPVAAHLLRWRTSGLWPVVALVLFLGVGVMVKSMFFVPVDSGVAQAASDKVMDQGEREGLRWAAANLDRRAVFFTNKNTYMASYLGGFIPLDVYDYLGFSGLQGWAWAPAWLPEASLRLARERLALQRAFLQAPRAEEKAQILAGMDVDYYFHSLRLAAPDFAVPACLREVHRTASLVIYENACRTAAPASGAPRTP